MSKKKAYAVDVKQSKDGDNAVIKVAVFAETLAEVEEKVLGIFSKETLEDGLTLIEITSVVQLEDFIVAE